MEDNKNLETKETEKKEEVKVEQEKQKQETIQDNKTEAKEESKVDESKEETKVTEETKEEESKENNKYSELEQRLKALEETNKLQAEQLNTEKIKNTIMEKVQDKDLQKTIMETGLIKGVEDIEKVMKIVELSKTLNKSKFSDGFKPTDEKQADAYQQAEVKGNVFEMIRQKMSRQ